MENIYEYQVIMHETCPCCGNYTTDMENNFKSFAEARDFMLGIEEAHLVTDDPIAKYYADDKRIDYMGE
jgi:hypothetical protein